MVWNKVTPLSQTVAIILFVGVFALGYYLGLMSAGHQTSVQSTLGGEGTSNDSSGESGMPNHMGGSPAIIASAHYQCDGGKSIDAKYLKEQSRESVALSLSDSREMNVPQAISASGARYANADESFVFWNKGNTAFIEEEGKTTFANCISK